jgi:ABC-2 type transport system ATP-binding protein
MKQRVVLAATFLTDPELLLLDEPMVGLDPRAARLLKNLLQEHCRRGRSVVMSTHSLADVEETCDRVGIIHRGRIVAIGTIDELREQSQRDGSSLEEIFLSLTELDGVGR